MYLRVGPPTKGAQPTALLYFMLKIANKSGKTLTLTSVDVSFPGSNVAPRGFPRDIELKPGTRHVWLSTDGAADIQLPVVPPTVKISLSFEELEHPVSGSWPLARHSQSYDFFCRAEGDGEYVFLPGAHGGDVQHFAYDVKVAGWTAAGVLDWHRTKGKTNEDSFAWERPVYSISDGIVLNAVDHHPDNPGPRRRGFIEKPGKFVGTTQITAVSVASIAGKKQEWSRFVVGVVTGTKTVELTLFAQTQEGDKLQKLCTAKGGAAERISVIGVGKTQVATLTQLGTNAELTLWSVADDGLSMTQLDTATLPDKVSGRVTKLTDSLLVTATRTGTGTVSLRLWQIVDGNLVTKPGSVAVSQSGVPYDIQAIDAKRFALATRTPEGNLRLEIWKLTGIDMDLAGAGSGGAVTDIALCDNYEADQVTTAVRTGGGSLKVIVWKVPADADPVRWVEEEYAGAVSAVEASLFSGGTMGVAARQSDGKLRLQALIPQGDPATLWQHHALTAGAVDQIALAQVPTTSETLVSAVSTDTGVLKVNLWQITGNNLVQVLYGNEIVQYVHLREGSVPDKLISDQTVAVNRGELIGLIGNAGTSSGVHLHIDARRVKPELLGDIDHLMKVLRTDGIDAIGDFRPLQFRGVLAMQREGVVKGGAAKNPLVAWDGHGAYFKDYVVLPPA